MKDLEEFEEQCERLRRRCFWQVVQGTLMRGSEMEIMGMHVLALQPMNVYVVVAWPYSHPYEEQFIHQFVGRTVAEAVENAFLSTTPPRANLSNLVFLKRARSV